MLCFIDKKSLASVFAAHKCYDPVLKCFHDIISLISMHKVCQDWYVTITDTPTHPPSWLAQFIWPQSDSWRCISYHWQWPLFHTDNYSVVVVRVCLDSEGLNEISKRPKQSSRNIFVYFQKCMHEALCVVGRNQSFYERSFTVLWLSCGKAAPQEISEQLYQLASFWEVFHLQPFPLFSLFPTPQVWTKYSPMACQSTIGGKYMCVNSLMKHIQ